ncbi:16S rRNA (cytosine(967)-C(5))-methyltransferase RsmB [Achromobacter insolitus]|uniref:16S rRNA (cytosine(967)-C(5))-methyltransferase n=1 Tax=Achromobacter insolitus TaxID=217204 RepID=A0A6S7F264_9BURK|nr:16S rRNA (cytosine(967)-C(5))-methyltransferase RsmB [Achromobacter insolitus]GLK94661.1 ribosomal RNA small subunit methyltransferase B [Achromobacter xylosoxidans]AVG42504.1 16S rRNA (cytosine(967)-C(5))-methyltransferase RsmB [Achromobacter insolitus]WKK17379.1 16S rRNA (cytosine(967)-C(5))-methyltransferase RsmB [Achromobacter insolitus]CAB3930894.1 Ribosomal RNA small subunit methyltransferase B [Achromobacter insolitus]CAB3932894.1 Ribosomal RNA small subunit methyltransferase B [Achr
MSTRPDSPNLAPPLSSVLLSSAEVVEGVLDGRSLTDALADVESSLRPATQALSFHAMRYLGWADAVGREMVQRYPSVLFESLLLVALTLLKEEGEAASALPGMPVYAAHTVVDQAVTAASRTRGLASYKGMLNACLRRFLRERAALGAAVADSPEAQWNHPGWWVKQLSVAYPQQWREILAAANLPAPLTLRVNRRRASREQVLAAFQAAGLAAEAVGQAGLVLATPKPVTQLPGFAEGWWSVQDAGAQLAAELLAPADGMRVLDACSAPGGKTAHLLELADIDLLALDADASRLDRVGQNLDRLGLASNRVQLKAADAADLDAWWDGKPFDAVLADVPCTASGIVRRHPDIRWLRRENDVRRTATLQARILDALWRTVAPGGRLLYVTCSIFPIEGTRQALEFMQRHPEALRLDAPGQLLPVAVDATPAAQHDGFFYALFAKQS